MGTKKLSPGSRSVDSLEQVPGSNGRQRSCLRRECRIIVVNLIVWGDTLEDDFAWPQWVALYLRIGLDSSHGCTPAVVTPPLFVFTARSRSILKPTKPSSGIDTPPSCSNDLQWRVIQFAMKDVILWAVLIKKDVPLNWIACLLSLNLVLLIFSKGRREKFSVSCCYIFYAHFPAGSSWLWDH